MAELHGTPAGPLDEIIAHAVRTPPAPRPTRRIAIRVRGPELGEVAGVLDDAAHVERRADGTLMLELYEPAPPQVALRAVAGKLRELADGRPGCSEWQLLLSPLDTTAESRPSWWWRAV
jgi:hypothetical protein